MVNHVCNKFVFLCHCKLNVSLDRNTLEEALSDDYSLIGAIINPLYSDTLFTKY